MSDDRERGRLARLGLLGSALSGRALQVVAGAPGERAWTDGRAVFLDAHASRREQLEALAVQASLLAAGSLEPEILRRLRRRPAVARRYLAVEGNRALAANACLLPPSLESLIDWSAASRADSVAASLAAALGREPIGDPPQSFGMIRARRVRASSNRTDSSATAAGHAPQPERNRALAELKESEQVDGDSVPDGFSSPGGGGLGRWVGRMLEAVRQLGGGGPPGGDAPTHWMRTTTRGGRKTVVATQRAEALEAGTIEGRTRKYPEWDVHRRRYRRDWCTVQEVEPPLKDSTPLLVSDSLGLRRPLARLGVGLDRCRRQRQGDDIDIDAAVESRVALMAGSTPAEAVYTDGVHRRRDLSVLILLDVSASVAEPGATGQPVHEQQRTVAAALTVALHDLGDRVALYAFHSQGRSAVRLAAVKRFDDDIDTLAMRRLRSLTPAAYSRLGAAIRHGAAVLEERGGTSRRLLVVLSDGLAYDHGYEPVYGAADARRALAEARRRGTGCLCLSIGASTDAEALRRVFGSAAHATICRPEQLSRVIGPLFRSALGAADGRRMNGSRRQDRAAERPRRLRFERI